MMVGNVYSAVSTFGALCLHLSCGLGIAVAAWVAHNVYATDLISDSALTLLLILVVESPIVILLYSLLRQNPARCSYLKAVKRGILGLPVGALVFALGAISLGAPVSIKHLASTIRWSLLMSLFTVTPAASVFGSSWQDWQRIFAQSRPDGSVDYMLCFPAHGAVIGSWIGAWPMPLDWERPWQEWPICVTYGGVAGYLIGMVASWVFIIFQSSRQHSKAD